MGFWKNIKEIFWPPKEIDHTEYEKKFQIWAFGTQKELSHLEKIKFWNALHSNEMMLFPDSPILHIEMMYELYDKHLEELEIGSNLYKAKNEI